MTLPLSFSGYKNNFLFKLIVGLCSTAVFGDLFSFL